MESTAKTRAASLSVGSNAVLVCIKLVVGSISGSVAIIAEAIHSGIDLFAALIAWFSVRISDSPPDESHPFGHGKAEAISGAIEAALIVIAAIWIVYEAVLRLHTGGALMDLDLALGVMALSALINLFVSRYLLKVAKKHDSMAIEADGHHLATDVWTSVGVALGLGLGWLTDWQGMDAVVAIAVALWIAYIGSRLTLAAINQLMDRGLPEKEIRLIQGVLEGDDRIAGWHGLRTRKAGSMRHVIVHIECEGHTPLFQAHAIADELECRIAEAIAPASVDIHVDVHEPKQENHGH